MFGMLLRVFYSEQIAFFNLIIHIDFIDDSTYEGKHLNLYEVLKVLYSSSFSFLLLVCIY